jgi:superfamily II DNA or RNA helicase
LACVCCCCCCGCCAAHRLEELQKADRAVRIIIFTEHNETQRALVSLFEARLRSWQIYEFNQSTPPNKRHKIIREFQADRSGAL